MVIPSRVANFLFFFFEKFTSSGREDVDVRMLGDGRPFVVEILNARHDKVSPSELLEVEKVINMSDLIKCRGLRAMAKVDFSLLKDGEESKRKSYR